MFSLKSFVVLAAGLCKAISLSALGDDTSIAASIDDTPTSTSTLSIAESSTTTFLETASTSTIAPQSPTNHGYASFLLEYSNAFQCGTGFKPSQMIVAVHGSWFANGAGCGRIMRVTGPRGTADVAVFDLCPCVVPMISTSPWLDFRQLLVTCKLVALMWTGVECR
ncbi:hypothetical protein QQZ08_000642 [Neonectria magnoliae]|uniref:Uncharacterized protein n=1 Tax=Neonectria magnoliae TaxID=2732573 RepID=A0ABR1IJ69_9HYPO